MCQKETTVADLKNTKDGYTFVGWLIKGTNEPFESQTYKVAGDTYLVAKWETDVYSDRWFTPDF